MRQKLLGAFAVLACSLATACESPSNMTNSDAGSRRDATGGVGDSCASTPQCYPGLLCISGQCALAASEGEPCVGNDACLSSLVCTNLVCSPSGGAGEPCSRAGDCDTTRLTCVEGMCRPPVRMRLCHCIYTSSTMTPVDVEMQVGSAFIGPIGPDICSPCAEVPSGPLIPYVIRRASTGQELQSGDLIIPATSPDVGVAFSAGVFELRPMSCDAVVTGFCGT